MPFNLPDLKAKTVLEVGAGQGESTRTLAAAIVAAGGGLLIVNDIDDTYFAALRQELEHPLLQLNFLRSSAVKLATLAPSSVDIIVCNHALCAIEAIQGQAFLALARFYQVLKPGAQLFIQEELPPYLAANANQLLWADQWALLQAAQLLCGQKTSKAFQPDLLEEILGLLGYTEVYYQDEVQNLASQDWLPSFLARMQPLIQAMDSDAQLFFKQKVQALQSRAEAAGFIEKPYVQLHASKPWRSLE